MAQCRVSIFRDRQLATELTVDSNLVIGRRDPRPGVDDPPPFAVHQSEQGVSRLIVADFPQQRVPREWFSLEPQLDGQFVIENLHHRNAVQLIHDEAPIGPGQMETFAREITVYVTRNIALRIQPGEEMETDSLAYRSLSSVPITPGHEATDLRPKTLNQLDNAADMVQLLQLALQVVQSANGTSAFYRHALVATTKIVDLDRTVLLVRDDTPETDRISVDGKFNNGWAVAERYNKGDDENPAVRSKNLSAAEVSSGLLQRMTQLGRTVVHDTSNAGIGTDSLAGIECAVVAPILNSKREIIGALYGDRRQASFVDTGVSISDLEATLVEILAGAIAGGIALHAEEQNRSKLAGFFSPKVADLLVSNPELMDGQDAEVTILFCDVRGFSAATEKLGPKKSIEWINDVMSELSQCVIQRDGVLVDYVGDELLAMWGAPSNQPNHAALAVDAAMSMLNTIEILRERWADALPNRFGAGIGINTGQARVGNIGSRQKFKYGPLGHAVNVGARLQTATKQLGVNCLVSGTTISQLPHQDHTRRIAKLNVVGINEVIEVFEIAATTDELWQKLKHDYESASQEFENGNFTNAARILGAVLPLFPNDRPSLKLLSKVVTELDEPTDGFNGVWRLTQK
ncbi:adenylate/guanylate cyclase domain-containing protein [Planctomycetes bacterium K23_9]|uniref:Adenylate cyclase 1 n=1 Tax=Stieleria marina TaxID=1930275 RepID=A0A517NY78_9BACT|nr:Adenylate cyclase 1 [Planctomycetes bacterium K23_9]